MSFPLFCDGTDDGRGPHRFTSAGWCEGCGYSEPQARAAVWIVLGESVDASWPAEREPVLWLHDGAPAWGFWFKRSDGLLAWSLGAFSWVEYGLSTKRRPTHWMRLDLP